MTVDFRQLPDLAVRSIGGSVMYANDESFAAKENLVTPGPAVFDRTRFGHAGKVYDGWETRRRREPGPVTERWDEAIVRLGAPGIVRGVVVDTAWFIGNYPPEVSVDGLAAGPHTPVAELLATENEAGVGWTELVARRPVKGDTENIFAVTSDLRVSHVRLRIHPDGGVARLRVHGEALPDPALLDALGTVDLAAIENGGRVVGCSNLFFGSSNNLLLPGPPRNMSEGWETARRRDEGNDWVEIALTGESVIAVAEIDTTYFLHNAPGWATLRGRTDGGEWFELLAGTALLPDTRHRFPVDAAAPTTHVRLDIHPDGGTARLRLHGHLTEAGRAELGRRWRAGVALTTRDTHDHGEDSP